MTNLSICNVATADHRKFMKYDVWVASCCIIIHLKLQRKAEQLDTESMPEDITIMELSSELIVLQLTYY